MTDFSLWFSTGVQHILDFAGYDHILFVTLLTLTFPFNEWKKLLVLITAFTGGHSLSLALSATNVISVQQKLIELLIALTILISAVYNLFSLRKRHADFISASQQSDRFRNKFGMTKGTSVLYIITLCFGLIHGMGFSYLLKSMLGKEQSVFLPLMYFNLGIELGQIMVVAFVLIFSLILAFFFKWKQSIFKFIVTCLIALIALKISAERLWDIFQSPS